MASRFHLLFLSLICTSFAGISQNIYREGVLINTLGDSTKGFVKLKGKQYSPTKILFKESNKSPEKEISLGEVSSIALTDYRYYKVIIPEDSAILSQFLVQGKANLYSWKNKFFLGIDDTFSPLEIEENKIVKESVKGHKEYFIQRKKNYIGILKANFTDCASIQSKIDRTALTEASLTNLVDDYNKCIGSKSRFFKKEIPLYRISISPVIGFAYTYLDVGYAPQFTYIFGFYDLMKFTQLTITPGINFGFSSPRINDRISVNVEARYLKNSFNQRVIFPIATFDDNEINLEYSYLYFPISVQNDFALGVNKSLYLKFGLLYTINLSNSYLHTKRASNIPNSNPVVSEDRYEFLPYQSGFMVGLGYKWNITGKINSFAEIRFENPGKIINAASVSYDPYVFPLLIGVSF